MDFLKELNEAGSLQFKDTKKINSLECGKPYPIKKIFSVKTKYGRQIKVDLGDFECFLPKRWAQLLTEEKISKMDKVCLIFEGMKKFANGNEGAEIKIVPLE